MSPRWFLRMARWVQNPPSENKVKFVFAIIAVCLVLAGLEWFGLWPDWMSVNSLKPRGGVH